MDEKLIRWARAVKARCEAGARREAGVRRAGGNPAIPTLWVFTDRDRLPDPRAVLARLPKGLCGVVFRPGDGADPALAVAVARLCRQRRFALVVAGNPALAARLNAGRHLSRGWQGRPLGFGGRRGLTTASAHGARELVRAQRLGADAVFLSPAFATASHPGAAGLGVVRWAALARGGRVLALGGITGGTAPRLPRHCAGTGVIGAVIGLAFAGGSR